MKTRFLLPHKYMKWGWILFIPFSIFGIIALFAEFDFEFLDVTVPAFLNKEFTLFQSSDHESKFQLFTMVNNNITNEILGILILTGCVFLTFSKQKDEDEFISRKRLESLLWATFVNSILLFLALVLFYDFNFFNVMVFNLYSVFILFIAHFYLGMRKIKRELE